MIKHLADSRPSSSLIAIFSDGYFTNVVESNDSKQDRRLRRRGAWASILGLFAVVFLWRTIWDWSEMYFTSNGSFIIGLILVGVVAVLQREHVRDLF